jgi:hypothetical protein
MTQQTQQDQYTKALERAHAAGLKVQGCGQWTHEQGGLPFVVVGSASELGRFHIVTVHAGRLACDCQAGQHGRMCMHRAVAREELAREAREAEGARLILGALERAGRDICAKADAITAQAVAMTSKAATATAPTLARDTAMLASRADNRGFSIWASV